MYQRLLNLEQATLITTLAMHLSFTYLYKHDLKCEYHYDATGYSIETWITFKR
jgi:hypothetical protein